LVQIDRFARKHNGIFNFSNPGISMRRLLVVLLACLILAIPFFAQSPTATITGRVVDPTRAVIAGATVSATNVDTGIVRSSTTNDQGLFTVGNLPPGNYRLEVSKPGFRTVVKPGVVLHVQDVIALNFDMSVGSASESVTVQAGAPLLNTESAVVATVVDHKFVENMPLNGRSFQSLINLTPGVVVVPSSSANSGGQFSVNGQRASGNSFMVDGVSANFAAAPASTGGPFNTGNLPGLTTFGTTQSLVSVDALQEFKVQTSSYSAEYGRQPGGQISIVTRSGTNQLHGDVFDYFRNDVLDARDYFNRTCAGSLCAKGPKPAERQNDFGGTLGGPVVIPGLYDGRNRTFFFFSYEGLRLRLPQFSLTNVPTLALRQQAAAGLKAVVNAFPLPNGRDLGNGLAEFSSGYSDPSSLDSTSIRFDQTVNSKLTVFGRYSFAPSKTVSRGAGVNLSSVRSSRLRAQTFTVGAIAMLGAGIANDFRANYSGNSATQGLTLDDFGGAAPPPSDALIPTQYASATAQGSVSFFNFSGRTAAGNPAANLSDTSVTSQRQINLVENVSWGIGAHQLKFGLDYRHLAPISAVNTYVLGTNFFSSAQVTAGVAANGVVQSNAVLKPRFKNLSAYVQDNWKFSRRLTLDFGVRWDINPAPTDDNGFNRLAVTQVDNLATMQLAPLGTKVWKTRFDNFGQRLGLAYRIIDSPGHEMVARGGFGVFYDGDLDASLAVGLYLPSAGSILIGDEELIKIDRRSLRSFVSLVPQDPILFNGTLRDNLFYGNPAATPGDLDEVLFLTKLHPFVSRLPRGLDENLGSTANQLSGGERKRIALARAMLQRPSIMILDEITGALDANTTEQVLQGIDTFRKDRTVILISHKPMSIAWADRIIALERGKIIDIGSHAELVRRCTVYERLMRDHTATLTGASPLGHISESKGFA